MPTPAPASPDFYSTTPPNRIRSNSLKTKSRSPLYSTMNPGVAPAIRPLWLPSLTVHQSQRANHQPKCHTMLGKTPPISLKTNDRYPRQVSQNLDPPRTLLDTPTRQRASHLSENRLCARSYSTQDFGVGAHAPHIFRASARNLLPRAHCVCTMPGIASVQEGRAQPMKTLIVIPA
jgi:hypothetical protein